MDIKLWGFELNIPPGVVVVIAICAMFAAMSFAKQ